ncbi:unnamed protein product, partial [Schistosoma margrebowiei]
SRNSSVLVCSNLPVLYDSSFTESSPDASVSTKEVQISTVNSSSHLVDSSKYSLSQHTNGDLLEALYDCEAENSDELTFNRGEIIQLIDRPDNDWWEGFIQSDPSRRGMFPVTYVKRLSDRLSNSKLLKHHQRTHWNITVLRDNDKVDLLYVKTEN